jgi:hypothetical protein
MAHTFEDRFSPKFFRRTGRMLDALTRFYFRYQLRGLERIPPAPCLLVANHSTLGTMELMCMLGAWWRHFGVRRRVTGLMHDFFLNSPGIGHYYWAIGAVPATRQNALAALKAGHDVLVFPGGDLDACRPFYQPRSVHFGSRLGPFIIAETSTTTAPRKTRRPRNRSDAGVVRSRHPSRFCRTPPQPECASGSQAWKGIMPDSAEPKAQIMGVWIEARERLHRCATGEVEGVGALRSRCYVDSPQKRAHPAIRDQSDWGVSQCVF